MSTFTDEEYAVVGMFYASMVFKAKQLHLDPGENMTLRTEHLVNCRIIKSLYARANNIIQEITINAFSLKAQGKEFFHENDMEESTRMRLKSHANYFINLCKVFVDIDLEELAKKDRPNTLFHFIDLEEKDIGLTIPCFGPLLHFFSYSALARETQYASLFMLLEEVYQEGVAHKQAQEYVQSMTQQKYSDRTL
jgi:hypothetical protein